MAWQGARQHMTVAEVWQCVRRGKRKVDAWQYMCPSRQRGVLRCGSVLTNT